MELPALQAFVSVADSGSFSQAAASLYVSQPAISKRIASLEHELSSRLFDRIGRRTQLTEAGRALLPYARRILRDVAESRQTIAALGGEIRGQLTVGTSHHVGLHRLPPVLREFAAGFPDVELDLHFMDSEQACHAVERGELELAVVTLPTVPNDTLITELVWPDPLDIVARADSPLGQAASVSLRELAAHSAVLPGPGTFTRRVLAAALQPFDLEFKVALETNYLEIIKMLVTVGLGWSALPRTMLDDTLTAIGVPGLQLRRDLGVVRHVRHTLTGAARAFVDVLMEAAEDPP